MTNEAADGLRLVAIAPEVLERLFTRDAQGNRLVVDWGELGEDGFYEPAITVDYSDNIATAERRATVERIRAAITNDWVSFGEEWTTEGTEPGTRVPLIRAANLHRILDEEAAR